MGNQHGQSGAWLGELLPFTSKIVDDICIIRSMHTEAINHDPAVSFFQTGNQQPGRPSMGSWLSYGLGSENKNLPAFCVLLSRGKGDIQPLASRNWGNGFLDSIHQGVHLQSGHDPVLYLQNPAGTDKESRGKMLEHIASLNHLQEEEFGDPEITARIAQYEMAYRMQTSVPDVMNFSDEPERSSFIYYTTLGASAICLTLAGHLGAEITHGKGFLTEPIRKQWQARIIEIEHPDSAIVFRDVIQPILNEKCLNCHNSNKSKNDLILADYQNIIKGGKNADAIVAGRAEESLLYKYALLPMDDSLHMPPKGKLQLDPEEIKLIGWWINTGANAHEKYVNLSKVDSIHSIMLSKFQPKKGLDLIDISFADQQKIKDLNNPYRTVQQISATKPYIAVFLGSKKDFSGKDLTELKDIGKQIISIDLGNSKVKDDDLKNLTQFPHLQKLHLQNIPVGDDGIKQLRGLRHLNVLNLSGTKVSAKTLDEVSDWENLKKLYLYNTAIPEESIRSLKTSHPELEVYSTQFDLTDTVYNAQLTIPICKIDSTFFRKMAFIEVKLSRGKVKYYYTLDGAEPTSKANLYTEPFQVNRSGELKIMATMDGWIAKLLLFHC